MKIRSNSPALRLLTEYSMPVVLLALCIFLSVFTYREQEPEGKSAGRKLAKQILADYPSNPQVMIVTGARQIDGDFATELEARLTKGGAEIVGVVKGEAIDVGRALRKLAAGNAEIDVMACTGPASRLLIFDDFAADFPKFANADFAVPEPYDWPTFLTINNLLGVGKTMAIIAVVAIGMTVVILTGGIDLSVGSLIALAAVSTALMIKHMAGGVNASTGQMIGCSALAILACGLVGTFSGTMVTVFRMPPFIVTLAVMMMARGLAYKLTKGRSVADIPPSFTWLGNEAALFNIPNAVILMLVMYALAHVIMSRTVIGRYIYAVGGNREAARLSGVPVQRVTLSVYIICGLTAGLAGVIFASRFKSGAPRFGETYELMAIAAVVVGGASINGGEGRILGTLIGALFIGVIQNGMNLLKVDPFMQQIVMGGVILLAVLVDSLKHWGESSGH